MPHYSTFEQHAIDDIMLNIQHKLRNKKVAPKTPNAERTASAMKRRRIGNKQLRFRSERNVLLGQNKLSGNLPVPRKRDRVR